MKILIADDDEMALMMLSEALTSAGHDVKSATNGQAALDILRQGGCRLVISDWEMPRISGPELCRAIRSEDVSGYVYVILLTSHDSKQDRVHGLTAGADDFITKPFDPAEMLARVNVGQRVLSMETRDVAIFAMAKLAESRDPETGAHLERVRAYCQVLAHHLARLPRFSAEVTAEYARLIYLTSPLHDIGKVGIPDAVLLKSSRLSDREFAVMKTHTTIGAQTLDAALQEFPGISFLQMGRDIAATHHERVDGTGYPAGLKGDQIPLCGRIVALADVYDALTSKRVYKAAFNHDVARGLILEGNGTQFDADIVDAFIENESRFMDIRERMTDAQAQSAVPRAAA